MAELSHRKVVPAQVTAPDDRPLGGLCCYKCLRVLDPYAERRRWPDLGSNDFLSRCFRGNHACQSSGGVASVFLPTLPDALLQESSHFPCSGQPCRRREERVNPSLPDSTPHILLTLAHCRSVHPRLPLLSPAPAPSPSSVSSLSPFPKPLFPATHFLGPLGNKALL